MIATDSESCLINWKNGGAQAARSISFSLCYHFVRSYSDTRALFICDRSSIERSFPDVVGFEPPLTNHFLPVYLHKIDMKYAQDLLSLKKILASMHLWLQAPALIVISDLSLIIDPLHTMQRSESTFMELILSVMGLLDDLSNYYLREKGFAPRIVITDEDSKGAYVKMTRRLVPTMWDLTLLQDEGFTLLKHTGVDWEPVELYSAFAWRNGGYALEALLATEDPVS